MTIRDTPNPPDHPVEPPLASDATRPPDDDLAMQLRGFGGLGIIAILAVFAADAILKPLGAVLVLVWVWRSRTPWRAIGYVRPKSWILSASVGIAIGVALKLLLKIIVMPLLVADPINHTYHYLVGNPAALPGAIYLMIVVGGFGEETVYRGFMFERLGHLLGHSTRAKALTVLIMAAVFASAHLADQGLPGAEQALITGLTFGTIYACTGSIFLPMCAHAAYDLAALAIIYFDLESTVAHLVFN